MHTLSTGKDERNNAQRSNAVPLFTPFSIRSVTFQNRIVVSPMCQYSSTDGFATDWHLVHLGSRAIGGAGLVMTEATAVEARGRISPQDLGIYRDEHIEMLARITKFIKEHGSHAGIQLAHAGRKASTYRPWSGHGELAVVEGRWQTIAPSALRFAPDYPLPDAMSKGDIVEVTRHFQDAARRALEAGFEVIELHAAHGYLLHEFLSPLSNQRSDEYGGSLEHRMRLLIEVVDAIRRVWPDALPLFVRISSSEWTEGGFDLEESVQVARTLKSHGVDLIDASSGGNIATAQVPSTPGYQVPFAEHIRNEANVNTGAVGLITDPHQANEIIAHERADLVFLARQMLRDPYWPLHAAKKLGHDDIAWQPQYLRARNS